jgi:hypothetical protein
MSTAGRMRAFVAIGGAAALGVSAGAQGALIFFGQDFTGSDTIAPPSLPSANTAREDFLDTLLDPETTSFEQSAVGSQPVVSFVNGVNMGTFGAETQRLPMGEQTDGEGRYPISGSQYLTPLDQSEFLGTTFDFDTGVVGLGFFITDAGDFNGRLSVEIFFEDLDAPRGTDPGPPLESRFEIIPHTVVGDASTSGNAFFWGIVQPEGPIRSITIRSSVQSDSYGIDDLTVATQIPTPGGAIALALGAGAVAGRRRRR